MSFEMLMLGLVTLLLMLVRVPVLAAGCRVHGLNWLMTNRAAEGPAALPDWVGGCVRAGENLRESYPPFAVAVLLLAFTGGFTPATALASAAFLAARLIHLPACMAGIPWLHSLSGLVGFLATLYLLGVALLALVAF